MIQQIQQKKEAKQKEQLGQLNDTKRVLSKLIMSTLAANIMSQQTFGKIVALGKNRTTLATSKKQYLELMKQETRFLKQIEEDSSSSDEMETF